MAIVSRGLSFIPNGLSIPANSAANLLDSTFINEKINMDPKDSANELAK